MIKVGKYTNIDRGADPNKEYYINQNGTYISLTKAELEKIASDLKLLGIADVIKSVCEHKSTTNMFGGDKVQCLDCSETVK